MSDLPDVGLSGAPKVSKTKLAVTISVIDLDCTWVILSLVAPLPAFPLFASLIRE
jgi:hypothetical protein